MRIPELAVIPLLLLLSLGPVWAQDAKIMDKIIATQSISVSEAAYLVFAASGKLEEDSNSDQAYALLQKLGWIEAGNDSTVPVKAAQYAYLLTRSFNLPGGLMSALFRSPRYSYRDLVAKGVFSGDGDPDDVLTGVEAVRLLGQVMDSLPPGAHP